ncbi:hypothetical protein [Aciditerrimonas ferrireducens]|jgi:hypothetical protein|uniref:hypothetical protein n=1 Tax=Aciditerrimonas ferrireducens TaxID=667306 RepID=UPI0020060523|nr:hypothetical protein [Aciditerrimonas ferrireducens]MCK4177054.1 hypothetical protein [Aciditerrimonas ferrireducens]
MPEVGRAGRRRQRGLLILTVVLGLLLASCASSPSKKTLRAAAPPNAPRLEGTGEVDAVSGPGGGVTWLVVPDPASVSSGPGGNARPDWLVERLAGGSVAQVTPPGIVVRGGVAVSGLPGGQTAWVAIGSYRYQLDGAVAVTTDGGRHWSETALSVPLAPAPQGVLAESTDQAVVLGGLGRQRELLTTRNGGASWATVAAASQLLGTDASRCTLEGLGPGPSGSVLVGSRCDGPRGLLVAVSGSGQVSHWSVVVPGASGGATTVLPLASDVAGSPAAATVGWQSTAVPGGVLEAGLAGLGAAGSLDLLGQPATITGGLTLLGGGAGPQGVEVLLAGRDPDRFPGPGPDEVLARAGSGAGWQLVAPVQGDGFGLVADGVGWSAGGSEVVVAGSSGKHPALATVPSSGDGGLTSGAARWQTTVLPLPQIPTASSLS